jgi:flagellin
MVINTNVMSLNAQRNLNKTNMQLGVALQRLSSGLRINSAKDDAAGLSIAESLTSSIRGNSVAIRNANDGISIGQTAEGALSQISGNLQRMREIAVQASNAGVDGTLLQDEVDQLQEEIARIVDSTEFNGTQLLDGSDGTLTFQIGSKNQATHKLDVSTANLTSMTTYTGTGVSVASQGSAQALITSIDTDITTVTSSRATFGAVQNRFVAVVSNLSNYNENLTAANSRIMDADFAAETAALSRAQILQQAGVGMLAQANAAPQNVLGLLG